MHHARPAASDSCSLPTELPARAAALQGLAFDLDQTLTPRDGAFWRWIDEESLAAPSAALDRQRVAELDRSGYGAKPPLLTYLAETLGWAERDFESRHRRFVAGTLRATVADASVQGLLERLHHSHKLALISNGTSDAQRGKLHKLGLSGYFDVILISDEVGSKKPERAIFERLLNVWRAEADSVALVGESPENDVLGARATGMTPIWVSGGRHWPLPDPAPLQIPTVLELEALLSQ